MCGLARIWSVSLFVAVVLVFHCTANDTYLDCVSDDVFGYSLLCLNATFLDNCRVHITVSVTNSSAPVLDGTMNIEQSRTMCTSYNACDLCAVLDDFAVDTSDGSASGCFSVVTKDCLLDFMENQQQLECFYFPNATCSSCLACPANCGGDDRGLCTDGHCTCREGWLPPTCLEEDTEPPVPPDHSDVSRCVALADPLNVDLCAEMWIHDCDAYFNITLNGRELANVTVDLVRSEQLYEPQCNVLFPGCQGCVEVDSLELEYSEEVQANVFNVCLSYQLNDACFAILGPEDLRLDFGCTQVPASECHVCDTDCNGNGVCVDGLCECDGSHHGFQCELNLCPNNCSGNGDCYNGLCDCFDLFLGDDCSIECTETVSGIHLVSKKWYNNEVAENNSVDRYEATDEDPHTTIWRGWMEVGHNTAGIDVGIGAVEGNETTTIAFLVRKDCPPSTEAFDFSKTVEMNDDLGTPIVTEQFYSLFEACSMREPHGTWFFAVLCLQGSRCPFRINVWVTPISMAFPGVKLFNSVSPPHNGYHVISLSSTSTVDILLKVKENDGGDNALRLHRRFEDCPNLSADDDEYVLDSPEPVDSEVYAYAYRDSFPAPEAGTWYVTVVPNYSCTQEEEANSRCPIVDYSLLVETQFICTPSCLNGGTCSQIAENTCICADNGYTGYRCDQIECLPSCEHGKCVGPNKCECDDGWMGPTCIDIDHQHTPVPFGHFAASTPASTYVIILLIVFLLVITIALVAVFTLGCSDDFMVGQLKARIAGSLPLQTD